MKSVAQNPKMLFAAIGLVIGLALLLLVGATYDNQIGRYRMSVITRNNFTDIYVIDTVTGAVKYLGKDEGRPFEEIKGK